MLGAKLPYAIVVATMAACIALATSTYVVIDTAVIAPLRVPDPGRLVRIGGLATGHTREPVKFWQAMIPVVNRLAFAACGTVTGGADGKRRLNASVISPGFFAVFQARAERGRLSDSGTPVALPQVIISFNEWRQTFAADPDIAGRSVVLNGSSYSIAGVAPAGFRYPCHSDVWILSESASESGVTDSGPSWVARLADGVTYSRARSIVHAAVVNADRAERARSQTRLGDFTSVRPLREVLFSEVSELVMLLSLGTFAALILTITTGSLVLLTVSLERSSQIGIRLMLGARKRDIIAPTIIEALVLSGISVALGLVAAATLLDYFGAQAEVGGGLVQGGRIAVAGLAGIIASMAVTGALAIGPAVAGVRDLHARWGAARMKPAAALSRRSRRVLMAVHVGIVSMIVSVSQVAVANLIERARAAPEFESRRVVVAELDSGRGAPADQAAQRVEAEALASLALSPAEIEAAASVSRLPLRARATSKLYLWYRNQSVGAEYFTCSPEYFDVLGIPIAEGRGFRAGERSVIIVSAGLAKALWGSGNSIGRQLVVGDEGLLREVVGVAPEIGTRESHTVHQFYLPSNAPFKGVGVKKVLVARCYDRIESCYPTVQRTLSRLGVASEVESLDSRVAAAEGPARFRARLLMLYGSVALLLAFAGACGGVVYAAATRRFEMLMHAALGATPFDLMFLTMSEVISCTLIGVALAAVVTSWLVLLGKSVWGYSVSFGAGDLTISGVLIIVTVLAVALLPAVRSARSLDIRGLRRDE